jgi:hypothetical protein
MSAVSGVIICSIDSEAMVEGAHLVDRVCAPESSTEWVRMDVHDSANPTVNKSHGRHHVRFMEKIQVQSCADILLI